MIAFLVTAVLISLSGVMAPGPMTAAVLAAATRYRHAGAWLAVGHAVVELPLVVLIAAGIGKLLELDGVRIGIGLVGGAFLLWMGGQLLVSSRDPGTDDDVSGQRHPFLTGIILSAANPYFLIWWATVGLALITQAARWGVLAFALFALVHWVCDLVWLETLSLAASKGTELLGRRSRQGLLIVCGLVLLGFGGKFLFDAGVDLLASPGA